MLTFVGLGLFDVRDISVKGLDAVRRADAVYLEAYTSRLMGSSVDEMEQVFGKEIRLLGREDVEQHPDAVIDRARDGDVVFLTGGDPMVSTTHADLRIRAAEAGVPTVIVHASSIQSAVCGLSGLQNYRFGKSCSVPFPAAGWFPTTPLATVRANLDCGLHTLVYLDIQPDRYMRVPEAVGLLEEMAEATGQPAPDLYVGIARAGSESPVVAAGTADRLKAFDFGPPLHILIVPADLHPVEREYLETFAGL
ncbi:diphthine synthase [Methanoculleus sp. FWC-SCC1]|uniref:Diphthine synthase n=1 Tax=Methanoculleus frigidifontis TaxID=2584085 RepID=A0ABT8M879_9EURY|nr:diphthine synthase [Methanoculleus sp. FWC-SCC1]MDN7024137.1 diphthine synthase [Methanoculleus sp. FWC-SCC1]